MSAANQGFEAAFYVYSELVLAHLFLTGNRRTGVAAAIWILLMSNLDCDANELLALPVGDLRKPSDAVQLHKKMSALLRS
jgi:prophage maintenance system killer protein